MCNSVASSESFLPRTISGDNNAVLHLCYDNFDFNEETTSGSGTTHSTNKQCAILKWVQFHTATGV